MTPQERRVMDNLATAVEFLLREAQTAKGYEFRGHHYNEIKAIRETLRDADTALKKSESDTDIVDGAIRPHSEAAMRKRLSQEQQT